MKERWDDPEERERIIAAQTEGKLRAYADGSRTVARGSGWGIGGDVFCVRYGYYIWVRSSYEITFANYQTAKGVDWGYEEIRVQHDGKTFVSDFDIDGKLYEVYGAQDKSWVVEAFEANGYDIALVGPKEIKEMRHSLSESEVLA